MLAKALIAGGHPRIIVRSDGEPPMVARVRPVRVVATLADAPLQCDPRASVQRTEPRKWHGRWRGESTRQGLRRQIPEDHGVRGMAGFDGLQQTPMEDQMKELSAAMTAL